ncbi:MAG: HAD family hydrolase [Lachnospiraceae bacterium]
MIKNIVFDIGNVLAHFRWQELLHDLGMTGEVFESVADATVRNTGMWNEFDRGVLDDEEIIKGCIDSAPQYEKEIRLLFANVKDIVLEYPYAKPWITELKERGFRVYLLSNYGKTSYEQGSKGFSFLPLVDGAVISYEVKHIKPEPEIYTELFQKYGLKPEECVFFDDREENIEAACTLGMHGIVFTSREKAGRELEKLLEEIGG